MDISDLLARDAHTMAESAEARRQSHQYPTRHALTSQSVNMSGYNSGTLLNPPLKHLAAIQAQGHGSVTPRALPKPKQQKHVTFELLLPLPQHRARLPMRVMISSHDTTESIITTVRNFYGLYDGPGVSFQDRAGNILIAAYENFENDMTVFVSVTPTPGESSVPSQSLPATDRSTRNSLSPRKPKLGAPFEMRPPSHPSRPEQHPASGRSPSPSNQSHRSVSAAPGAKPRSRPYQSWEVNGYADPNLDGYSSSDGGNGSVTSSRRSRAEAHASAEISVDNILEGGRRKRAKFESSELPLFVPPQVPMTASISSVSPQRRTNGDNAASPMPFSNQRTFTYTQPMPSPQSHGRSEPQYPQSAHSGAISNTALPYTAQYHNRTPVSYHPPRQSTGGILPTPEPTVGSVISDEDVALQLMRLGDMSNFSHGRTSTSTVDDALSGKAEAASSDEDTDAEDDVALAPLPRHASENHTAAPRVKKQRMLDGHSPSDSTQSSGDDYEDGADDSFKGESDGLIPGLDNGVSGLRRLSKSKNLAAPKPRGSVSSFAGSNKSGKSRAPGPIKSKVKTGGSSTKVPMSPASLTSQSRKASMASTATFQTPLGDGEEDLSSKPRCQRCRKSKKGCDRQRPCGRCKDAGIGHDGCVSEDEGNGRRGRYGRHMGVAVKKDGEDVDDMSPPAFVPTHGQFLAPALPSDKSKKRKRLS